MPPLIFIGQNCVGGVSPAMAARLTAVEVALRAQFLALGSPGGSFEDWCGRRQPHLGMHVGGHRGDTCPAAVLSTAHTPSILSTGQPHRCGAVRCNSGWLSGFAALEWFMKTALLVSRIE
jgi:hypothetical protein